jgi:hypothetical protein
MVRMLPPYKHAKSLAYGYRKWTQVLELLKKVAHIVHSSNLELDVTCCYNVSTPFFACTKQDAWKRMVQESQTRKRML